MSTEMANVIASMACYLMCLQPLQLLEVDADFSSYGQAFSSVDTATIYMSESLSIPNKPHHADLTSLKNIFIFHFPNLVSFPQGGLPTPNLERLWIMNCQKLKSLSHRCAPSLNLLKICQLLYVQKLNRFQKGVCQLLYLNFQIAGIDKEEKPESFPDKWLLPSTLTIWGGPATSSSTSQNRGCPPSCRLKISKCPLLRKWCQRDKGKDWSKISHILCIVFEESDEAGRLRPLDGSTLLLSGRALSTKNEFWLNRPCKRCPDTPSDDFVSHSLKDQALDLFSGVMAESSSPYRRLSEIVGGDLSSLLSFRSAGDGTWAVTGCLG
ncbi:hypothetical protein CK203_108213 [Vitis vinifera]|uniref:Uncharacterized protein n=1 Tax=Vitis vinifera TaxID=29760 RepID=A0A438CEY0_VITVI|nr:hypothetical protein CK203_108213 [Vitis vinifera]